MKSLRRFRLCHIFSLLMVIGIVLGIFAEMRRRCQLEHWIADQIHSRGGACLFDTVGEHPWEIEAESAPLCDSVARVSFGPQHLGTIDLSDVKLLRNPRVLTIENASLNSHHIDQINRLDSIRVIRFERVRFKNRALLRFGRWGQLVEFVGSESDIYDEHIDGISDAINLETLNLSGTHISDASIERLRQLPGLMALNISRTSIRGDGIGKLGCRSSP